MRVWVIDGRSGGLGRRLVVGLQAELGSTHDIVGLAANEAAAAAMKRAGASHVCAGAAAIVDTDPHADVIIGSLKLVLPGAMLGEVMPNIVQAILGARARKVLLPINRARVAIVETNAGSLESLISASLAGVRALVSAVRRVRET